MATMRHFPRPILRFMCTLTIPEIFAYVDEEVERRRIEEDLAMQEDMPRSRPNLDNSTTAEGRRQYAAGQRAECTEFPEALEVRGAAVRVQSQMMSQLLVSMFDGWMVRAACHRFIAAVFLLRTPLDLTVSCCSAEYISSSSCQIRSQELRSPHKKLKHKLHPSAWSRRFIALSTDIASPF